MHRPSPARRLRPLLVGAWLPVGTGVTAHAAARPPNVIRIVSDELGYYELSCMIAYAGQAHQPVQEGTFQDTTLHEKDRRAKYGYTEPPPAQWKAAARMESMPTEGLIANTHWKILRVSSESSSNQRCALGRCRVFARGCRFQDHIP